MVQSLREFFRAAVKFDFNLELSRYVQSKNTQNLILPLTGLQSLYQMAIHNR